MKQFNLSEWLKDKSRKVVTRDGRPVRIVCWDSPNKTFSIVGFIDNKPTVFVWDNYGYSHACHLESKQDLFFADEKEESQSIEIPFGAFDSEFIKDEYLIPEGCEARIEGNKVIIEKIQKEEELTEFEKELINLVFKYKYWDSNKDKVKQGIKKDSKLLLDLARKELQPEIDKKLKEKYDCGYSIGKFDAGEAKVKAEFEKGRANALKDLPKWNHLSNGAQGAGSGDIYLVRTSYGHYYTSSVISAECDYLVLTDLEKLPKEE